MVPRIHVLVPFFETDTPAALPAGTHPWHPRWSRLRDMAEGHKQSAADEQPQIADGHKFAPVRSRACKPVTNLARLTSNIGKSTRRNP